LLTLATWNIHRCIGADGRYDPTRTRDLLRSVDADVIALQEVEVFAHDPDLLTYLCEGSDWRAVHGITMERDSGDYGNAVLTRLPVEAIHRRDISVEGREPRGILDLELTWGSEMLRVLATHFGLRPRERRRQLRRLLDALDQAPTTTPAVTALLGDFNEWLPRSRITRRLGRALSPAPAALTFPARRPVFALDRVFIVGGDHEWSVEAVSNSLAREASDHLPLVARQTG
jgi:endonuclease/exonuclease/phosphatase family metal-dependent hydrolase